MFAYCQNNPVTGVDPSGTRIESPDYRYCGGVLEYTDAGTTGEYERYPAPIVILTPYDPTVNNCLAFSIYETTWTNVGDLSGQTLASMNVEDVATIFVDDIKAKGWDIVGGISGPDYRLHEQYGEYLVALRTGKNDYHFMVCLNGIWYQKCGGTPAVRVGAIDPRQYNWNKPASVSVYYTGKEYITRIRGYIENYYDSDTLFFAITPH